ncbi:N-acetylmuramoyl-L-alanine amidase [Enterococcus casseliflavus]|uniref:peptidoglycan DD-metalloendopeptidase family protein n=1 Tax=Enterococcus casseliflavus TaxID=37734 RepID=UPI001AD72392|nr:peptidoglycan DD-metalloendopeptidase family protein [Enterococcus casseliflavus]MBO6359193.1 N-acetylmuramoyl-L-alanine amidase [Enterococcus casseliflavus]MBO6376844.1 N-acetylmuramoyl-L-alanine amidase [Enterococcus casseliflavus]
MKNKKLLKISSTILLSQMIFASPLQIVANEKDLSTNNQIENIMNQEETSKDEIMNDPEIDQGTVDNEEVYEQNPDTNVFDTAIDSSQDASQEETSSTKDTMESTTSESFGFSGNKGNEAAKNSEEEITKTPIILGELPATNYSETSDKRELTGNNTSVYNSLDESFSFEKNETVVLFVEKIGESARSIGQKYNLYASVMIAQAILESASGQSKLAQSPNYNLFGIKGRFKGKSTIMSTQEELNNGQYSMIQSEFRVYENYEESLEDYANLIKNGLTEDSRFYEGAWKSKAKTYQEATAFLTGRYATDSKYNMKLNGLIETYNLAEYDDVLKSNTEDYSMPVKNYTISSRFGQRGNEFHRGLDLASAQGEPILASRRGTIIRAEYHPSWGNYVIIRHNDDSATLYAHQEKYCVNVGEEVEQGQLIGYVGSTGNSTGSHLHFEVCKDNSLVQSKLINPETVLFK